MIQTIELDDIVVDVIRKRIKNVHLKVYPPNGRVRISAPMHMSLDSIRAFVIAKLEWIKQAQATLRNQEQETRREYVDHESHHVWGQCYLLKVVERDAAPRVEVTHDTLVLQVRPGTDVGQKRAIFDKWYRDKLKDEVPALIEKWENVMGVKVDKFYVRQMKTLWGSCTPTARSIRLNTELAKKPRECLEYVVVHEIAHLLEPTHNHKFVAVMDRFMLLWRNYRDALNRSPVRREGWVH